MPAPGTGRPAGAPDTVEVTRVVLAPGPGQSAPGGPRPSAPPEVGPATVPDPPRPRRSPPRDTVTISVPHPRVVLGRATAGVRRSPLMRSVGRFVLGAPPRGPVGASPSGRRRVRLAVDALPRLATAMLAVLAVAATAVYLVHETSAQSSAPGAHGTPATSSDEALAPTTRILDPTPSDTFSLPAAIVPTPMPTSSALPLDGPPSVPPSVPPSTAPEVPLPPSVPAVTAAPASTRVVTAAPVSVPRVTRTTTASARTATAPAAAPSQTAPSGAQAARLTQILAAGIPARARTAYTNTATQLATRSPACKLPWTIVAAIGALESSHGRHNGATVDANGVVSPSIFGVLLNGSTPGTSTVTDTDGGTLDGDSQYDRAVGPMQFLPATWRQMALDGDGDGTKNPQDLDDAALTAGNFLCTVVSPDLSTQAGQWNAAFRYNRSSSYANDALALSLAYATGKITVVDGPPPGATTAVPTVTVTGNTGQNAGQTTATSTTGQAPVTGTTTTTTVTGSDGIPTEVVQVVTVTVVTTGG